MELTGGLKVTAQNHGWSVFGGLFLLRKIALPYPHKCLFGFVEQNVSTDKNFFKEYSCHKR